MNTLYGVTSFDKKNNVLYPVSHTDDHDVLYALYGALTFKRLDSLPNEDVAQYMKNDSLISDFFSRDKMQDLDFFYNSKERLKIYFLIRKKYQKFPEENIEELNDLEISKFMLGKISFQQAQNLGEIYGKIGEFFPIQLYIQLYKEVGDDIEKYCNIWKKNGVSLSLLYKGLKQYSFDKFIHYNILTNSDPNVCARFVNAVLNGDENAITLYHQVQDWEDSLCDISKSTFCLEEKLDENGQKYRIIEKK